MSLEENKAVIQRWADALNRVDLQALDNVFAPDYVHHVGSEGLLDREGFKRGAGDFISAFPVYQGVLERMVAEGDLVAFRWAVTGAHQGAFAGIPPTLKQVRYTFNIIARIADGRIQEDWEESDFLGALNQLGYGISIEPQA